MKTKTVSNKIAKKLNTLSKKWRERIYAKLDAMLDDENEGIEWQAALFAFLLAMNIPAKEARKIAWPYIYAKSEDEIKQIRKKWTIRGYEWR